MSRRTVRMSRPQVRVGRRLVGVGPPCRGRAVAAAAPGTGRGADGRRSGGQAVEAVHAVRAVEAVQVVQAVQVVRQTLRHFGVQAPSSTS